ncbi:uncharacterized protein [Haliotis cracherodii]|uniref:uncharacterized protein n=1 Tax=Haliotis cracherodii TaxID=6455 RepID=UPI0039EB2E53
MYAAYASTLLLITHLSHCAAELKCPELGYIGSKASLTCIGASTTHTYSKPSGSTASTCDVTSQQCINTGDDTGTVINETQTVITISIVKKSDAGEWGCTLGSEPTPSKCSMTIAKLPSCNITSVPSPDELRVNQNVSLSVNAAGYYCSTGMKLQLRTGSNVTELTKGNLDAITDDSFQLQLNLTESYFGNVTLEFTCDSKQKDISCSGIQSLMPSAAELKCPELGYIGSKASLTCIGASTTHAYSKPSGSTASTCDVTSQQCINTGDDTGTVINETQTVITISIVKKSDAGEWGCTLGSEPTPSKCSMTIAKLPSCNITSVPSPDELRVNQNVSLSVNAAGYYCSTGMKLQLRTGSNVTELTKGNLDAITDDSFQLQLNLTESYFGNVTLEFTCDSKQKDISCSGIQSLMPSAAELKCPELGYIGSKASLTCIGASTTHAYSKPSGSTASTCDVTSQQCINTGDDTGTVINETQTVITISIVKKSDAGEWGCTLGSEPTPSKCSMTIAKLPSCNITSVPSPDELRVNQNVSLSVNAAGYYCSTGMKLQLRTGSNVTELTKGNLDAITDDSFQLQLNLTESYFGNVTLEFTCDSKQKDISCSGIQSLMPTLSEPPSCEILSSRAAEEVTVRVQDYHCSDSIQLYLKTRNVTGRLLNTSLINTTGGMFEITVNVTTSLEESKKLVFVCGNTSWEIACPVKAAKESNGSNSSVVIIGAVVAGSVFVIIIVMLVLILVKMKQTQQPETHSDRNVYEMCDVDGRTDETAGHEYNTLNLTPIEGGSIYNVISS